MDAVEQYLREQGFEIEKVPLHQFYPFKCWSCPVEPVHPHPVRMSWSCIGCSKKFNHRAEYDNHLARRFKCAKKHYD